ncbi:MAG: preprotein translocase, YajC subunit [Frankiales bacterium]|jgi:preprotein translocase subunit YajC|nr:preprotein translocase, YajC subunit [Frankiales bacterium]
MAPQDLVLFVVAGLGAWLLLVRPQKARARALAEVRSSLAPGSRVMTTAGLHATVTAVEDDTVLLEIAPGVQARFAASAVVRVLSEAAPGTAPGVPQQGAPPAD